MKYNFPLAKSFGRLFADTISVSDALSLSCSHHLGDHFQQMSKIRHQNLWHPVKHQMMTLTLTLKYLSHHCHLLMNPRVNMVFFFNTSGLS